MNVVKRRVAELFCPDCFNGSPTQKVYKLKLKIIFHQYSMDGKGSQSIAIRQEISVQTPSLHHEESLLSHALSFGQVRAIFSQRLLKLPTEERSLAVKIHSPPLVLAFRKAFRKLQFHNSPQKNHGQVVPTEPKTFLQKLSKVFFDSIILLSDENYLDSIGFDFNLVDSPERLFDFLMSFNDERQSKWTLRDILLNKKSLENVTALIEKVTSKEELAELMCHLLTHKVISSILLHEERQLLKEEKIRKKELSALWSQSSGEKKLKILRLGMSDGKQLTYYLLNRKILMPPPEELEREISYLEKADKNEFCNRILKSRLQKGDVLYEDYHQLLHGVCKLQVDKRRRNKSENSLRKRREQRSKSVESNETNETQHREEATLDIEELIRLRLNRDITNYSDDISEHANSFFDLRVEAFGRLEYLFQTYFNVPIHLFGSCACGLAVKNSDIDVAIDEKFLENFQYAEESKRVGSALKYVAQSLEGKPWVKKLKLIQKAAIPIINLTIDTSVQMYEQCMEESDFYRLNSVQGEIEVDLTIQTKQGEYGLPHLGVSSTLLLRDWLQDVEKLQEITIILKYYLYSKSLNDTYSGGLKTYSLVVLIIAYIKDRKLQNSGAVQTIMKGLTHFYGYQFDETLYGIDIAADVSVFYKKEVGSVGNNSAALQIKDPINGRVMTKSCYSFGEIKKLMRDIYTKCFEGTQLQIENFCSNLNPKTRRLATHQILHQFNMAYPENNFSKVIES